MRVALTPESLKQACKAASSRDSVTPTVNLYGLDQDAFELDAVSALLYGDWLGLTRALVRQRLLFVEIQ